jgi:hypothetical protein
VDDIIIIYNSKYTSAEQIMHDHNQLHKNMKYTLEKENNQMLDFLDHKIHRQDKTYIRHIS